VPAELVPASVPVWVPHSVALNVASPSKALNTAREVIDATLGDPDTEKDPSFFMLHYLGNSRSNSDNEELVELCRRHIL
jgi:hypothetical protein